MKPAALVLTLALAALVALVPVFAQEAAAPEETEAIADEDFAEPPAEVPAEIPDEMPAEAPEEEAPYQPPPGVRLVVIMPEQIDTEWFWYYYTEISEHVVQAAVEKALIGAGFDVIDLTAVDVFQGNSSINQLWDSGFALRKAAEMGATHLILGRATATRLSTDSAYGVTVVRASAEITARLIRVSDAKVLAVEDASATAGGQAQKTAGRDALKQAGRTIAGKLLRAAQEKITAPAE